MEEQINQSKEKLDFEFTANSRHYQKRQCTEIFIKMTAHLPIWPSKPSLSSHRVPTFRSLSGGKAGRTPPSIGIPYPAPVDAAIPVL